MSSTPTPPQPPPPGNLFERLASFRRRTTRVAIIPGQRIPDPQDPDGPSMVLPIDGGEPMVFEIQEVTANEVIEADALITATPPPIFEDHPNPKGVGLVKVMVGYDYDCPKFIAQRTAQVPCRNAALCIFGCPALAETCPGNSLEDKARTLAAAIPAAVLYWLTEQIENTRTLGAGTEEAVAGFLARGSARSPSSKSTNKRSRTGAKNKPSNA